MIYIYIDVVRYEHLSCLNHGVLRNGEKEKGSCVPFVSTGGVLCGCSPRPRLKTIRIPYGIYIIEQGVYVFIRFLLGSAVCLLVQ